MRFPSVHISNRLAARRRTSHLWSILSVPAMGICVAVLSTGQGGCEATVPAGYVQVRGTVVSDHQPLSNARVVFVPSRATRSGWEIPFSLGTTNEKGEFELRTEKGALGVYPGWNDVWVIELADEHSAASADHRSASSKTLRYSRHRIDIVREDDGPTRIEIDHQKNLHLQTEMGPPSWAHEDDELPITGTEFNPTAQENRS